MNGDFNREELLQVFLAESEENLGTIEQMLLALENAPEDRAAIDAVFRAAHTLKGNSASLGFDAVAKLAHAIEDLLDKMRSGKRQSTPATISLLLRAGDGLRRLLASGEELSEADVELIDELHDVAHDTPAGARPRAGAPTREEPESAAFVDEVAQTRKLRIDLDKLDTLLNLTGELSIAVGRLNDGIDRLPEPFRDQLLTIHGDVERTLGELQTQVRRVRMVPIGPRFEQQRRLVRDLAASSGKPMRLITEGREVEVDASLIEHIKDPLTHLIRNAADHAVEAPEIRQRKAKDPVATIHLRAFYDGAGVVVQVEDDGRGFDVHGILERARERGMVPPKHVPSREEILNFVFAAGFTTAEKVTEISGRGVGMDVVHRNIAAMRGTVSIATHEGVGSTISIRLPLTLAILEGLAVSAGGERFLVPMQAIRECMAMPEGHDREKVAGILETRERAVPFVRLSRFFGLPPADTREQVLLVESEAMVVGLVTDDLIGETQAVLKPLGKLFRQLRGATASTIFGDGTVGLVVDVPALVRAASAS
jgi:two-component system chemotaxis sensor kinase CheA